MLFCFLLLMLPALAVAGSIDDCPGYAATNISENANTLTATLSLAGDACNVYGDDISDLTLLVEYQAGKPQRTKLCERLD